MRKLTSTITPWSGVVGGGLTLRDETGRIAFLVNFMGTKEETQALAEQLNAWVNERGISVPERTS